MTRIHRSVAIPWKRRGLHQTHKGTVRRRAGSRPMWHVLADTQRTYDLSERLVRAVSNWRVFHGADDDVETLINIGADVNVQHGTLRPLHCACMVCDVDCLRLLLQHGARVNDSDGYGRAPLHYAVENDEECTEVLLEQGANVDINDSNNDTPLHWSAYKNKTSCMRLLLEHNATIDACDYNDNTPLSWAAQRMNYDAIRLLLDYNADASRCNYLGQSPVIRVIYMKMIGLSNNTQQDDMCLDVLIRAAGQFSLRSLDVNSIREIHRDMQMASLLLPICTTPRPLSDLCRHTVRSTLGHVYLPEVVPKLPLPPKMQDFLLLK